MSTSLSTNQKWGIGGLAAGAAVLPTLFGGGDDGLGDTERAIKKNIGEFGDLSKGLNASSSDLFASIVPYLKAISGGDQQAVMNATMPERRRVMDQYDAARKAIAEFSPRSGGTAASMNEMRAGEASDLAQIGGQARTQGVNTAAGVAGSMASLGLNATGAQQSGLNALAGIQQARSAQSAEMAGQWGQAAGLLAGLII